MKKLIILTALFMATTAAHAGNGISFEIDGQKIRIEAPRNCDSLSCIKISAPGFKGFKSNHSDDDDDTVSSPPPAKSAPAPAPVQATAPQPVAPVATTAAPAPAQTTVATVAPVNDVAQSAPAVAAPARQPAPVAAAPAPAPTTPLGVWATEENKGNVRIEECGGNLCGYAVKTGEKILINMKPEGSKWSGRIHDPDSGQNYDSTMAMKGTSSLRVQGCAFGGMFCGGQTWKRVS
jgi:uncharacterized protein (DUF2147 family)